MWSLTIYLINLKKNCLSPLFFNIYVQYTIFLPVLQNSSKTVLTILVLVFCFIKYKVEEIIFVPKHKINTWKKIPFDKIWVGTIRKKKITKVGINMWGQIGPVST